MWYGILWNTVYYVIGVGTYGSLLLCCTLFIQLLEPKLTVETNIISKHNTNILIIPIDKTMKLKLLS